jgi:hypothetical protein
MFSAPRSTGIILLFGAERRESRTKAMQAMAACLQSCCNKRLTAAGLYGPQLQIYLRSNNQKRRKASQAV